MEPYASLNVRIHDQRILGCVYVLPKIDERAQLEVSSSDEFTDMDATSAFDVVTAANTHKEYSTLLFPNVRLGELVPIQLWCERNDWTCVVDESESVPMLQLRRII